MEIPNLINFGSRNSRTEKKQSNREGSGSSLYIKSRVKI